MKLLSTKEKISAPMRINENMNVTEALINGKRIEYDACSQSGLETAKTIYNKGWKYIGSGNEFFINGNPNLSKDWYHFFVYTGEMVNDTEPNI